MSNKSTPVGFADLIEKIKKWGAPFIGVALFVFGLRNGVKEVRESITWAVAGAVSIGWLFLFWAYTSKVERELWQGIDQQPKTEKVPQFSKGRKWALAGMILLPLITVSGFVIAGYIERRPSNKTIVLVADFQGPDQKYAITPTVINKLRRGTQEFSEVEIKALRMTITEQEGSMTAREKGREKKASIVIWGFYDEALTGTLHIETLSEQHRLPSSYAIRRNGDQIDYGASFADKSPLTVRESMAGDMTLITLLLIGVIHYESKDYDEAIRRFSKALEQTTSSQMSDYQSDLLTFRGNSFHFKGDFDSAIADYDQAIKLKPDSAAAYNNRGIAYEDKGQDDRAIADFDEAIKLKPDSAAAYNNRGIAYSQKGQDDRAIADFDEAIKLKPDYPEAYTNRGNAHKNKRQYDRAIADYDQAIKLKPDYAEAYTNRGIAYSQKGQDDRAIADHDQAIKLKPDYADAYNNRGIAYSHKGQDDRAIADFDEAIKLKPDSAAAYYNRGIAYSHKGQDDRAIADYDQAIKLKPDYFEAYTNRGNAHKNKRQYDRAIADYDQAIEIDPRDAAAYENLGWLLATASKELVRNGRKAVEYAHKACELTNWQDPFILGVLGAAYAEAGNFDEAINWENKALSFPEYGKNEGEEARKRLQLYRERKPYHTTP